VDKWPTIFLVVPRTLRAIFIGARRRLDAPKIAQDSAADRNVLSTTIAKWLIPSVSALFVVVGYVVQAAHESMLGLDLGTASASTYLASAAVFLRDVLTAIVDALGGLRIPKFDGYEVGLIVSFIVVAAFLGLWKRHIRGVLLVFLILAPVVAKFVILDWPLVRIENALVSEGPTGQDSTSAAPLENRLQALANRAGPEKFAAQRALALWSAMLCSRVSQDLLTRSGENRTKISCKGDEGENRFEIASVFLAHTISSVLLILIVVSALRRKISSEISVVAILVLTYSLMWPYAYGKLLKTTFYEFGHLVLRSSMDDVSNMGSTGGSKPTAVESQGRRKNGIVLSRASGSTKILVAISGTCPRGKKQWDSVKLWSVNDSEIAAIREIYRVDVIAWKTLKEKPCPVRKAL